MASLKASPSWSAVAAAVRQLLGHELDAFLADVERLVDRRGEVCPVEVRACRD